MWVTHAAITALLWFALLVTLLVGGFGTAAGVYLTLPEALALDLEEQRRYIVLWFSAFAVSAFLLLIQRQLSILELRFLLDDQRRLQQQIDQLAELRREGVQIYANAPTAGGYDTWVGVQAAWRQQVLNMLEVEFTGAVVEWFEDLGVLASQNFQHAIHAEHTHQLQMLAKRLSILETLIQRHTRVLREGTPTLGQVLASAFHSVG